MARLPLERLGDNAFARQDVRPSGRDGKLALLGNIYFGKFNNPAAIRRRADFYSSHAEFLLDSADLVMIVGVDFLNEGILPLVLDPICFVFEFLENLTGPKRILSELRP